MSNISSIHPDLEITKKNVYDLQDIKFSCLIKEEESAEYGAYTFKINNLFIKYRVAKITPKKAGQFVTLWKRIAKSPIKPHDFSDEIDFFVISVRKNNCFGQFVFPKSVLCEKGIVSKNNIGGKLAIRIYPPWDKDLNKQALKTQAWQLDYFFLIEEDKSKNAALFKTLYQLA
jgi:hypothetical protein